MRRSWILALLLMAGCQNQNIRGPLQPTPPPPDNRNLSLEEQERRGRNYPGAAIESSAVGPSMGNIGVPGTQVQEPR
jgi:hypothetical protein